MNEQKKYAILVRKNKGDVLLCTAVAANIKAINPNSIIIWFTDPNNVDLLWLNPDVDEIIPLPNQFHSHEEDLKIVQSQGKFFEVLRPAPYNNYYLEPTGLVAARVTLLDLVKRSQTNWVVPFVPKVVLADEEVLGVRDFIYNLPKLRPLVVVESHSFSDQSPWSIDYSRSVVSILKPLDPIILFTASHYNKDLVSLVRECSGVYGVDISFRQNAELFNWCDAFIGVSSGISTLVSSSWCFPDVNRIEVVHGEHWSGAGHINSKRLRTCTNHMSFISALWDLRRMLESFPTRRDTRLNSNVFSRAEISGVQSDLFDADIFRRLARALSSKHFDKSESMLWQMVAQGKNSQEFQIHGELLVSILLLQRKISETIGLLDFMYGLGLLSVRLAVTFASLLLMVGESAKARIVLDVLNGSRVHDPVIVGVKKELNEVLRASVTPRRVARVFFPLVWESFQKHFGLVGAFDKK